MTTESFESEVEVNFSGEYVLENIDLTGAIYDDIELEKTKVVWGCRFS